MAEVSSSKIAFAIFCTVMASYAAIAIYRACKGKSFEEIVDMIFNSLSF